MKEDSKKKYFKAFTDGSSTLTVTNPDGFGGYAYIILDEDDNEVFSFCKKIKGNISECELTAGLEAMKWAISNEVKNLLIWTDSRYFVESYNRWMDGWKRRGWKKTSSEDIKHKPIIEELYDIKNKFKDYHVIHIKGHNGNYYNEKADELAGKARLS